MFGLVKWAYRLAQQTERQRIAAALENARRFGGMNDYQLDEKEIAARNRAVDQRVNQIIDAITQPNNYEESRYSILYPRDGE